MKHMYEVRIPSSVFRKGARGYECFYFTTEEAAQMFAAKYENKYPVEKKSTEINPSTYTTA